MSIYIYKNVDYGIIHGVIPTEWTAVAAGGEHPILASGLNKGFSWKFQEHK